MSLLNTRSGINIHDTGPVIATPKTYASFDPEFTPEQFTLYNDNYSISTDTASWNTAYLKNVPISGMWAMEVTPHQTLQSFYPHRGYFMGISAFKTLSTYIGGFFYSTGYIPYLGRQYLNNTYQANYWKINITPNIPILMVIDFDYTRIGIQQGTELRWSNTNNTLCKYVGLSLYDIQDGIFQLTINTGQQPFSPENKTLLPEGCNEGLWI
jgi:hypothetical protein